MWISKCSRETGVRGNTADLGQVTIGGDPAGVFLSGERRNLPIYAPCGFWWKPKVGQDALVIKSGQAADQLCVAGVKQGKAPATLAEGEVLMGNEHVWIKTANDGVFVNGETKVVGKLSVSGDASISGSISMNGAIYVGGVTLESFVKSIVSTML